MTEAELLYNALKRLTAACATNAKVMEFIDLAAFEQAVDAEEQYENLHGSDRT